MGKEIDILNAALREGVQPASLVDYMGAEDVVALKPRQEYDKFSSEVDTKNPNAPTPLQIDKAYSQALKVKQMKDEGYYRPRFTTLAPFASMYRPESLRPFLKQGSFSNVPVLRDEFDPSGFKPVMSLDRDAYESSWYAVPDRSSATGFKKVEKTKGWEMTPGQFVFEANPETGGMTKMPVLMNEGDDLSGVNQLSVWGPPEEFTKHYVGALFGNVVSAIPRLFKSIGTTGRSINNFGASISSQMNEIFEKPEEFDTYVNELRRTITNAKDETILSTAIQSGDRSKMLDAFNYLEKKAPVYTRDFLYKKRMPEGYNMNNEGFNMMINTFDALSTPTADDMKRGAFDSFGSFIYQGMGVLADLAPQMIGAIGGAQIAGKVGSMIAGGFIGGSQAVGATMEAMQDAGFDIRQQSRVLPFVMAAMPLTEGLVSGGWMGRYLGKDVINTYKQVLKEEFANAYAKGGATLSSKQVVELTKKSLINFWENPAFKKWVQTSYGKELGVAMLAESGQELSEDWVYNFANLYENKARPEYYGDVINSGINDLWGDDGVFNGHQMLETIALTAFATGISDFARASASGRLKKGSSISQQKIASEAWAADQAAQGNLDTFLEMAREEGAKETNVFGSKKTKLNDFGAENIVIDPESAPKYAGYNIGVPQQDGSILIDNMADARQFNFLQTVMMFDEISKKNGLDGSTLNSKMLHELIDINGSLMSSSAIKAAIDVEKANDAVKEYYKSIQKEEGAELDETQAAAVKVLTDARAKAQNKLNEYVAIEEGTNYSKSVNDAVKHILTTYDIAEEETKKQMNVENINPNDKKTYSILKSQWNNVIGKSRNYDMIKSFVGVVDQQRSAIELRNKQQIAQLENMQSNTHDSFASQIDEITNQLNENLAQTDDRNFLKGVKSMSQGLNNVFMSLDSLISNEYMNPDVVKNLTNKYTKPYQDTLDRLTRIRGNAIDADTELQALEGIDEPTSMMLSQLLLGEGDYKNDMYYKSLNRKNKKAFDSLYEKASLPIQAAGIQMPEQSSFEVNKDDYAKRINDKLVELNKPVTNMDAYESLLEMTAEIFQKASDAVNPEMRDNPEPNPFKDMESRDIMAILNGEEGFRYEDENHQIQETTPINYNALVSHLENSYDVASRLDGKEQFKEHSTATERDIIGKLAEPENNKRLTGIVNGIKANTEKFKEMSGLNDLSSINMQQHKKALLITGMANDIEFLASIINANGEIIPKQLIDDAKAFVITDDMLKKPGNYDEKQVAALTKAEDAIKVVIDIIKEKNVLNIEGMTAKLLEPFKNYIAWNVHTDQGNTYASNIGFDGNFQRGGRGVYDVNELRLEAARINVGSFQNNKFSDTSSNKIVIESLQRYQNILMMIASDVTMGQLMTVRKRYNNLDSLKKMPSTFEQEFCEDSIISFMTGGSKILNMITNLSKDIEATSETIRDLIIIPGNYGVGKTQHVLNRAFDIMRDLNHIDDKTKMTFFAPSIALTDTHSRTFVKNAKDGFKLFNELKNFKPSNNGNEFIIIDEGSLLNKEDISILSDIQAAAKNNISIIVLADLNQMRDTNEMDTTSNKYPRIMHHGYKMPMLTEQFSTDSPIIKGLAAYWNGRASDKNTNAEDYKKIPMGYFVSNERGNTGVQYSSSDRGVIDNFIGSPNTNKALIFEDQDHFDRVMNNGDETLRQNLKDSDGKIFFIYYDRTKPNRVIQGLRAEEVYIVSDYKTMRYHNSNNNTTNDYIAMYTAIGRASRYVNMNMGNEASKFMTKNALEAFPIGDTKGKSNYIAEKVSAMSTANTIRFESMDVIKRSKGAVVTEDVTTQDEDGDNSNDHVSITIDGEKKDFTFEVLALKNGRVKLTVKLIDGTNTYTMKAIEFNSMPTDTERNNAITTRYKEFVESKKTSKPKVKAVDKVTVSGKIVQVGQQTKTGEVTALTTDDNDNVVGVEITVNGKPMTFDSSIIGTIELPDHSEDKDRVFLKQADEWLGKKAVYAPGHFFLVQGNEPSAEELNEILAMQTFIRDKGQALGLKFKMKYMPSGRVMTKDGFGVMEDFLVVTLDVNDAEGLRNFAKNKGFDSIKPGYVKNALAKIRKSSDLRTAFSKYMNVATMQLPSMSPIGVVKGKYLAPKTFNFKNLSDAIKLIENGFNPIISDDSIPADVRDNFMKQKEAQIAIAKIHDYCRKNVGEDGFVKTEVNTFDMDAKVIYDNKRPQSIQRFIDSVDGNMFSIDMSGLNASIASVDGEMLLAFRNSDVSNKVFTVTVHAPFLTDKNIADNGRLKRLMSEDEAKIKEMVTSSGEYKGHEEHFKEFEKMFRQTHLYHILMSNKLNFMKERPERNNRGNIHGEYQQYFLFSKDGKYVNVKGSTTAEKKENIRKIYEAVYTGGWKNALYDYVPRVYKGYDNHPIVPDSDQYLYTNAQAIQTPYSFITFKNIDQILKETTKKDMNDQQARSIENAINDNNLGPQNITADERNYMIDGVLYDRVSDIIPDPYKGNEADGLAYRRAGTNVHGMANEFFTKNTMTNPGLVTDEAFVQFQGIMKTLRAEFEKRGERVYSEKVVYDRDAKVAGSIDIITVDDMNVFRVYDFKTMKSMANYERYKRSSHTNQLSAYSNLFNNMYGVLPKEITIIPLVTKTGTDGTVSSIERKANIKLTYDDSAISKRIPLKAVTGIQQAPTTLNSSLRKERRLQRESVDVLNDRTTTIDEAQKVFGELLGQAFMKNNTHLVAGYITDGSVMATGMAVNGHVYYSAINGGVRFSTPYHESLHIVWNSIIDPDVRKAYEAIARRVAKAETGLNLTGIDLEEWMASDFVQKAANDKASKSDRSTWNKFKTFLKKLVNFFNFNRNRLDKFYQDIMSGKYRDVNIIDGEYKLYEEAEFADDEDVEEESQMDTYENEDSIIRYVHLKEQADRMFPGSRGLVDAVRRNKQFNIVFNSKLGNLYIFEDRKLINSLESVRDNSIRLSDECGNETVEVRKDGQVTIKKVSEVDPSEYKFIYATKSDLFTDSDRKSDAQSAYRTWFINKKENITTILQNIIPEYDPENQVVGRGKLYDGAYSRDDINPYADGFSAEMKLQLATVPMVKVIDGKTIIDVDNPQFVDRKLMIDLTKRAGTNAYRIYQKSLLTDSPMSHYDAFITSIHEIQAAYGLDQNADGSYKHTVTQALKSFEARFCGTVDTKFEDTYGDEYYPLMGIAERVFQNLSYTMKQPGFVGFSQAEEQMLKRAKDITAFMSVMASTNLSSVVTRNAKFTIFGNQYGNFSYLLTEYSNNPFDAVANRIKNNFDNKFTNGIFTHKKTLENLEKFVSIAEDGSISVGRNNASLINVTTTKNGQFKYSFAAMDDYMSKKNEFIQNTDIDDAISRVIDDFNVIRNIIGLPFDVMPDMVIREFLMNDKFSGEMIDNAKRLEASGYGNIVKGFKSPAEFMASFIANVVYSMKAQTTKINVKFDYKSKGQARDYNADEAVMTHIREIKNILTEDGNSDFVLTDTDGGTITFDNIDSILPGILGTMQLPYKKNLEQFMKRSGAQSAMKNGNEDEYMTSIGVGLPIPSQFFTSIDMIASQVASMTGDIAGHEIYGPDGKKRHTLQGRNPINSFIDGSADYVKSIKEAIALNPELKKNSPLYDSNGEALAPYFKDGKGHAWLDHLSDFFGMDKDSNGYRRGSKNLTTHDLIAMSVYTFMDKIKRSTAATQIISVPTMPLSDTQKIYMLNTRFSTEGFKDNIVLLRGAKNEFMKLNYPMALYHVKNYARQIERRIELSRNAFMSLVNDINEEIKSTGHSIPVPTTGKRVGKAKMVSEKEYVAMNEKVIGDAVAAMPEEVRAIVMERVIGSSLVKGNDINLIEKDGTIVSFSMGRVAADNIDNISKVVDGKENVYSKENRDRLLNANEANAEKIIKEIFGNDFRNMANYMESMGFTPTSKAAETLTEAGMFDGYNLNKEFYDPKDNTRVNEPLFAYFMMFHISNNAFDDVNGSVVDYKNVLDQIKRTGTLITPKNLLNTNMMVGDHLVGSAPTFSKAITSFDFATKVNITDSMSEEIKMATDGQSYINPQFSIMFDISTGGDEYSVGGAGKMQKTLTVQRDPYTGKVTQLKHAALKISESNFQNHWAYRRMVLDMLEAEDQLLEESADILAGTDYEGFSWSKRFEEYYNESGSMEKAMNRLHNDMVASQYYGIQPGEAYSDKGRAIYNALAGSVIYGINTLNTRKNNVGAINDYVPSKENYRRPSRFSFETLDNSQMGVILSSEQPLNDSKKMAPYQQQEAFMGNSSFRLDGNVAMKYGSNPGVAINKIRQEIYEKSIEAINNKIGRVDPVGVERIEGQPYFHEVDWLNEDIDENDPKYSYAVAQFEWFMRDKARSGMANASIPGNYVEMLSSKDITREIPQMRNKMVQTYRKYINREAIKPGMTGIRTVQASGLFHDVYVLKNSTDTTPFTYQEAIEHLGLKQNTLADFDANMSKIEAAFTRRGLKDMRVEGGESKHGEVVMPYIYAQKLGLRRAGEEGATRDETLRDMFTLRLADGNINVKNMTDVQIEAAIVDAYNRGAIDARFYDSFLIRKAIQQDYFSPQLVEQMRKDGKTQADMLPTIVEDMLSDTSKIAFMIKHAIEVRDHVNKSLTVFANRVPSNRLGSGGMMEIVAFHNDGNEIYIPVGMTLLNDSDFDIDQLAVYMHKIKEDGLLSTDEVDKLQSLILDITDQVYMAKENQNNIFIKSSIKSIQQTGDKKGRNDRILNSNSAFTMMKGYNDNKGGADSIGIFANTLSATAWLQSMYEMANTFIKGKDNPFLKIVSPERVKIEGKQSLIVMVGDWLQASLDNPKNNTLGKYGITKEAVPIAAIMIANGPKVKADGSTMTDEEFFEYIKDFFNNYSVSNSFADAALGTSNFYSSDKHNLYLNVDKHLANVNNIISGLSKEDLEQTKETPADRLADFVTSNLLQYIDKYNKEINETQFTISTKEDLMSISNWEQLVANYTKSVKRNNEDKVELEKVTEYRKMLKVNEDYYRVQGFLDAKKYLTELKDLIIQAEAIRGVSNIMSLRNGMPTLDSDIDSRIKLIEVSFGQSMKDILSGKTPTDDEFMNYYMTHSNEYADNKSDANAKILATKAMMVHKMIDLNGVINAIPLWKTYLKNLYRDQKIMGHTFVVDSQVKKQLEAQYQKLSGFNDWKYANQRMVFHNAFMEVALDKYFSEHQTEPVTITTPDQIGSSFIVNDRYTNMDMTNVFDRQIFSKEFPNFIMDNMKAMYDSREQMEKYFTRISPSYAGISEAFFNEEGAYIGNLFISKLDRIGKGENKYLGLNVTSSNISEVQKRELQSAFDKLPKAIRNLFVMNELIVNKMNYRNGSIIDIIGIDPYREGISQSFDRYVSELRNGVSLMDDPTMKERFFDYVAMQDGMTKYVKQVDLDDKGLPMYLHTYRKGLSIPMTMKFDANDMTHQPLFFATGRAGISFGVNNPVSDIPTIALNADDHNNLYLNGEVTKVYAKDNSYISGNYMTDGGDHVQIAARKNDPEIEIYKDNDYKPKSDKRSGITTLEELETTRPDMESYDISMAPEEKKRSEDFHGYPSRYAMTMGQRSTDILYQQKMDAFLSSIERSLPVVIIHREDAVSTRQKGHDHTKSGWVDIDGIHINMDFISAQVPMHEFTHAWSAIIEVTNPGLHATLISNLDRYIEDHQEEYDTLKERHSDWSDKQIKRELLAMVAGFVTEEKVERYLRDNGIKRQEGDRKNLFTRFKDTVKRFWDALRGFFSAKYSSTAFEGDMSTKSLSDIFNGLADDIISGKQLLGFNSVERAAFERHFEGVSEGFEDPFVGHINMVSDLPNLIINNPRPEVILNESNRFDGKPHEFADMVFKRAYTMDRGNTYYIEWLGKRFKFDGKAGEETIKNEIINDVLPYHKEAMARFSTKTKDMLRNIKMGSTIDEAIEKAFESESEDGMLFVSKKEMKRLIEYIGGNDRIEEVTTLRDLASDAQFGSIVNESLIGFNPLVIVHSKANGVLEFSISDISAGDLGRSDTLTGENHKLTGRWLPDYRSDSDMKWSNDKKDARAAALTLTIAGMNHFAKKNGLKIKVRRAGVYGMRGGLTGTVNPRNIYNLQEAFNMVKSLFEIEELKGLVTNNVIQEVIEDPKSFDASGMGISHLAELQSYYSSDMAPEDISNEFREKLLGSELSRTEHIKVLRARQHQLEKDRKPEDYQNDYEYIMISKAILFYNQKWHVNNMSIGDISHTFRNFVNVHNVGNDIIQYASLQFETSKSVVVGRTNEFGNELANKIRAMKESHSIGYFANSEDTFGHLFPKTTVIADKDYKLSGKTYKKGDEVQIALYNQIYSSKHPDTASLLRDRKLTEADVALADFIVDNVKKKFLDNMMYNNRFNTKYTIEEATKEFEQRYTEGTIPVIPATQEQRFSARRYKDFARTFVNKLSGSDIQWGDVMNSEFTSLHARFENQISFDKQLRAMGLEQHTDKAGKISYATFDLNANMDQSNNLEYTIKMFFMDMERAREFGENVLPIFNDCIALANYVENNIGSSQLNVKDFLREYKNLIVEHKRKDETSGNTLDKKAGTIVRSALAINSFVSLAYRPLVWLKSAYFNEQSAYISSLANNIANLGIKNGNLLDMPTVQELTKAHELVFSDYKKVWDLAHKFQLINGNERDVLESAFMNVTDKHLFKQQIAHIGNWYTDAVCRSMSMVAYMLHDGSYDAHIYDPKTGTLTYDVTKDRRFYNENGNKNEGWDVVHKTIMERQASQGLLKDNKQVIGYDYTEINKRIKWYVDKYIIGSMDPYQRTLLGNTWAGASMSQFRGFSFDKIWNAAALGQIKTAYGSKLVPIKDENGEWIAVEHQMQMESVLQSVVSSIWEMRKAESWSAEQWQNMDPIRRKNLVTAVVKLGVLMMIMGALKAFDLPDRDRKKLNWLCSEIMIWNTIANIYESPIPLIANVKDMTAIVMGQKRFGKIYRFTGPVNDVIWFYELFSDNDDVTKHPMSDKEKAKQAEERARERERKEAEEIIKAEQEQS